MYTQFRIRAFCVFWCGLAFILGISHLLPIKCYGRGNLVAGLEPIIFNSQDRQTDAMTRIGSTSKKENVLSNFLRPNAIFKWSEDRLSFSDRHTETQAKSCESFNLNQRKQFESKLKGKKVFFEKSLLPTTFETEADPINKISAKFALDFAAPKI